MMVFNCFVREDEQLKVASTTKQTKNKKKQEPTVEFETFKPVECETCHTEVGVYDPESEIYHFFNVLASHS